MLHSIDVGPTLASEVNWEQLTALEPLTEQEPLDRTTLRPYTDWAPSALSAPKNLPPEALFVYIWIDVCYDQNDVRYVNAVQNDE